MCEGVELGCRVSTSRNLHVSLERYCTSSFVVWTEEYPSFSVKVILAFFQSRNFVVVDFVVVACDVVILLLVVFVVVILFVDHNGVWCLYNQIEGCW